MLSPGRTGMQEVESSARPEVASLGHPTPRSARTLEEVAEGAPFESGVAPDRRRPIRP
jgi:hypothetical protein